MGAPKRQFSRPSVNLSSGLKRSWRRVPPWTVAVGDIVADKGLVENIEHIRATMDHAEKVIVTFYSGERLIAWPGDFDSEVLAFTLED